MEPLPSNVMYYVNQIAGYSKNTVKLQNINSDQAGPGVGASQTTVTMPTNSIINLESLALHATFVGKGVQGDGTAGDAGKDVYALCPRSGLAALAQRVSWAAGGIALDNGPTPYSVIYAMKNNTETSLNKAMSDQRVLNNPEVNSYVSADERTPLNLGQEKDLICNQWLGFTEAAPCFLRLTIQWEAASVLPCQHEGKVLGEQPDNDTLHNRAQGCIYSLRNMFWTVDVVSFSNGLLDAMNDRIIREQGQISVVYPQYQVFSVDAVGPTSTVRGSASTMSLNRVYGASRLSTDVGSISGADFKHYAYGQIQPPLVAANNVGFATLPSLPGNSSRGVQLYYYL